MDLEYHISGALKRSRTQKVDNETVLYDEILYYEDCVDRNDCIPQYGGNIARMAQWLNHSNPLKGKQRDAAYTYDELNRLTNVNEQLQNDFDEEISYDTQGRIRAMQRGSAVLGNGGQYTYKGNQLQNISAGMDAGNERNRQGTSTNPNYQYDSDGNRIADHSQNHVTTYNADGMAEREELLQDGNEWRVEHRYSVGSQRTAKMVFRKVNGSWQYQNGTFYTGLGMEVRENATGEGRVITQLPNGLGRYAQGSANDVEWNIKNHLGSTMLVWGQGSAKSAYDYWSFGKRMALTLASEKVTEEFTGKELDEETGLNYFGARYYDSEIGGWVSVDPMRQFASPYLYAGNGTNPLNGFDKDGMWYLPKGIPLVGGATHAEVFYTPFQVGFLDALVIKMFLSPKIVNAVEHSEYKTSGERNAFRHAVLAVSLLKLYGLEAAINVLKNHEIGHDYNLNGLQDSEADIANNLISLQEALFVGEDNISSVVTFAKSIMDKLVTDSSHLPGNPNPDDMDILLEE